VAEDEAVDALVSAGAEEVAEMAGSRIVVPVVFVGAAAEVVAVVGEPVTVGSPVERLVILGLSRGGGGVSVFVMFVRGVICCEGRWSMESILVDVEVACVRLARGARLGFCVLLVNLMWCLDSISQSGIG
jgi:hypothetical protein